jgi:hypothetical protein
LDRSTVASETDSDALGEIETEPESEIVPLVDGLRWVYGADSVISSLVGGWSETTSNEADPPDEIDPLADSVTVLSTPVISTLKFSTPSVDPKS